MRNSIFSQQSNAITEKILTEIQTDRVNMVNEVCTTGENILRAMQMSQLCDDKFTEENKEKVNAVKDNVLVDIMNTLKVLTKEINDIKSNPTSSTTKA